MDHNHDAGQEEAPAGGRLTVSPLRARVRGSELRGSVRAPPSKSFTQRAAVCALLACGRSTVVSPSLSDDGLVSASAARAFGADLVAQEGAWEIRSAGVETPEDIVYCRGSATSLRLFTAVSALAPGATVLTGDSSLRRRPVGGLLRALSGLGVRCFSTRHNGLPPVVVEGGGIRGGEVVLPGDVSSQYISALIFACAKADGDTKIRLSTPLESADYVRMSLQVLESFGGRAAADLKNGTITIPGMQSLSGARYLVEGDYSSAAFMLAGGALAGEVSVTGLKRGTLQGDRRIVDILSRIGCLVSASENTVTASRGELFGADIDCSDIPDLVPVLGVIATQADGTTVLKGLKRLRLKESDRIESTTELIGKMGGRVSVDGDAMKIEGPSRLRGGVVDPKGDHRIAMAAAIAGTIASGETWIADATCVSKSYPMFFDDLRSIGGDVEVLEG